MRTGKIFLIDKILKDITQDTMHEIYWREFLDEVVTYDDWLPYRRVWKLLEFVKEDKYETSVKFRHMKKVLDLYLFYLKRDRLYGKENKNG